MKINFKKEHFDKLKELAVKALLNNDTVVGRLGNPIDIVELIHGTTINSLNQIRLSLTKNQVSLERAKEQKDLVNLIIGYKRYKQEVADNKANKKALQEQLSALKESQKTPEDKIKELEAQLANIETEDF